MIKVTRVQLGETYIDPTHIATVGQVNTFVGQAGRRGDRTSIVMGSGQHLIVEETPAEIAAEAPFLAQCTLLEGKHREILINPHRVMMISPAPGMTLITFHGMTSQQEVLKVSGAPAELAVALDEARKKGPSGQS